MSHYFAPTRTVTVRWVAPRVRSVQRVDLSRYELIDLCVEQLREVRNMLTTARAPKAAAAVARAMKSVEGAKRHAAAHGWNDVGAPPEDPRALRDAYERLTRADEPDEHANFDDGPQDTRDL